MTTRRQVRLQAVQILYLMRGRDLMAEEALESYGLMGYEILKDSAELCKKVRLHLAEIDSKLAIASPNWRLDRMAWVDLAILRVAVLELLEEIVPRAVVINEAIELAHEMGGEDSFKFVNGVLDQF